MGVLTPKQLTIVEGVAIRAVLALVLAPTAKHWWYSSRGYFNAEKHGFCLTRDTLVGRELGGVLLALGAMTLIADQGNDPKCPPKRPPGMSEKASLMALVPWVCVGGSKIGNLKLLPEMGNEWRVPVQFAPTGSFGFDAQIWRLFPKIFASNSKSECKACLKDCLYLNNPGCCSMYSNIAVAPLATAVDKPLGGDTSFMVQLLTQSNELLTKDNTRLTAEVSFHCVCVVHCVRSCAVCSLPCLHCPIALPSLVPR